MREVVLDTETTGFDPFTGDRLVEIGCVELVNHMPSGQTYHQYVNPERDMPDDAFQVHGLSIDFLSDKPVFKAIAQDFIDFIGDAKLIIHNASFDMKFLNAELDWAGFKQLPMDQAIDTLDIARRKFPGAQNSLDSLCRRFNVDNSVREKHGALLDSELLADVYLELLGGRQPDLMGSASPSNTVPTKQAVTITTAPKERIKPISSLLTNEEIAAHEAFIDDLGDAPLWKKA